MKITIEITDDQYAVMRVDMADPDEWVQNCVIARAAVVVHKTKQRKDWTAIVAAATLSGVDISDEFKIVSFAISNGSVQVSEPAEVSEPVAVAAPVVIEE